MSPKTPSVFPFAVAAAAWQRAHVGVWWECERGSVSFSRGRVFFSFSLGRDGLCALCGPDVYLWECRAAVARGVTHRSPAISAKPLIRHMTFSPGAASLSSAPPTPTPNHRPKTSPQILGGAQSVSSRRPYATVCEKEILPLIGGGGSVCVCGVGVGRRHVLACVHT